MGITQVIPQKDFYITVERTSYALGQICYIPTPYIEPLPKILDVERSSPDEHEEVKFCLRQANCSDDFRTRGRVLPLKYLNLKSNEELLVQRAKKRPGIIISNETDAYSYIAKMLRQKGKKHLQEDALFVVPIYSIESNQRRTGYPQEMVEMIKYLLFRQFFYLPKCSGLSEGIARFDRIQVVVGRSPAAIDPCETGLSTQSLSLMNELLSFCITGFQSEKVKELRDVLREVYKES